MDTRALELEYLVALATPKAMQVVLGIDSLILPSIPTNKLLEHQRPKARRAGIAAALGASPKTAGPKNALDHLDEAG